jgi:hypothetical protein
MEHNMSRAGEFPRTYSRIAALRIWSANRMGRPPFSISYATFAFSIGSVRVCGCAEENAMRNPIGFLQALDSVRVDREETIADPPSFEEVMREIAITILVCLLLALAAELLTRGLALG